MTVGDNTGKHSTRDAIIETIKKSNAATVNTLADAASVSPVTVRHHLNALQAEGMLLVRSERRQVGRPHYVYSLSEKGHELFPKRYARLSRRLLSELKQRFPENVIDELLTGAVASIVAKHEGQLSHLPIEKRLDYLVKLLGDEGYMAQWVGGDEAYHLKIFSCPLIDVVEQHHELCSFDQQLMEGVLEAKVVKDSCVISGDSGCQFSIAMHA